MKIALTTLVELATLAIRSYGYDEDETKIILVVLLYAQLRGNNQGLVKLVGKGIPKDPDAGPITVVKETKLSAVLNGNRNMAMLVLKKAADLAVQRAREHGFGVVGTNNTNTSSGAIGYYARAIAEEGFLAFVFAGSSNTVTTNGSYEPLFGTNPLAFAVPSTTGPIVLDMATAAIANYGLLEASIAGRTIADDIAYDMNGNPTTDPVAAMKGAIRPFDRGHKGAGLLLMIEILTGPLVGAAFAGLQDIGIGQGHFVYALDIELLADHTAFDTQVSHLVQRVKNAKKLPGVGEIFVPGEQGNRRSARVSASGKIELETNLYRELQKVAAGEAAD